MNVFIVKWADFSRRKLTRAIILYSSFWTEHDVKFSYQKHTVLRICKTTQMCARRYTGLPSLWWWVGKDVVLIVGVCLISLKQRFFFFYYYYSRHIWYSWLFCRVFLCAYVITTESVPDAFTVCNHRFHIQDVYIVKTPASLGIRHNILGVETLY